MSRHLVTGATGYLGRALTRALVERGDTVGIIIRDAQSSSAKRLHYLFPEFESAKGNRLIVFSGDITKPGLDISPRIESFIKSQSLSVWHLAASLSFSDANRENVMTTNIEGTRNVVELANRYAARFYHVSTAFVCGNARPVFGESQLEVGQRFYNWYERSKYMGEKIVREECKVPFVVFRPSIIVGNADEETVTNCTFGYYRFTSMFYLLKRKLVRALNYGPLRTRLALRALGTRYEASQDALYAPWLRLPYPLNSTVNIVHIEDVCRAMLAADREDIPSSTTFHLTQPDPPSFIFLLESLLADIRLYGVGYIGLPAPVFRSFLNGMYCVLAPLFSRRRNRHYFQTLLKYLPYISRTYDFSLENTEAILHPPAPITRSRLQSINRQLSENAFAPGNLKPSPDGESGAIPDSVLAESAPATSLFGSLIPLDHLDAVGIWRE